MDEISFQQFIKHVVHVEEIIDTNMAEVRV